MARRIVLCGASSVGKTTLAADWCREHKGYYHIKEVARDVMKKLSISTDELVSSLKKENMKIFLDLQCSILEEQSLRETANSDNPFISDRGPDPLVYIRQYASREAIARLEESQIAKTTLDRYRESSYLLVVLSPLPGKPTDDGFRMVPSTKEQKQFTELMCGLLRDHKIPYIYISETGRNQRMNVLVEASKGLLPCNLNTLPLNVPYFLPLQSPSQPRVSIRTIQITEQRIIIKVDQPFPMRQTNRIIDRYGQNCLLLVNFHQKVASGLVQRVLFDGILVNGKKYNFLGCSSSGLKDRKCYMLCGSVEDVKRVWRECGEFRSIKSVSKCLKRIGLLFSAAWPTNVCVADKNVFYVDDTVTKAGNFTDGCGAVGAKLAQEIIESARPHLELTDYAPSVLQIRYQGCKGVVVKDRGPKLPSDCLLIRKSMKKFNPGTKPFLNIWLCDCSRPYSYGHLNKQFIMLFSALGVKNEVFLQKQEQHLERVVQMMEKPSIAIEMLRWSNKPDLAAMVACCSTVKDFKDPRIQQKIKKLQSKFVAKIAKLSIPVLDSRTLFGVCDPFGILEYGECFIRPTINGKPKTIQGLVTVAKNPCYMLGDVRSLNAVNDYRTHVLEDFVDCIVFPTQGRQPHPTEIAGSDLDGDQYFVTWDEDLIISSPKEPYDYPSTEATGTTVTREMMIDFFARYCSCSNVGLIDSYYKAWADCKGVSSYECQELGKLFARSVDSAKTGDKVLIPPNLKPKPCLDKNNNVPIWKKMESRAEVWKKELKHKLVSDLDDCPAVSEEFVWNVALEKSLNMSEFQLFLFFQKWVHGQAYSNEEALSKLRELSMFINFGEFTADQQVMAIDVGMPTDIVTNDLNKSKLLDVAMLEHFSFHSPHCGWRFYLHTQSFDLEWHHLFKAVQCHPESFLILQLDDGIRFILHFLLKIQPGITNLEPGSVVTYLFSPHFNLMLRHVLGQIYSINLDTNNGLLQIYRNKNPAQSFLWISRERMQNKSNADILYDRISIDLPAFRRDILRELQHPKVNKEHFQSVEIFVRNFHHKPAYFDVLLAKQPNNFDSNAQPDDCELEEIPKEDEDGETIDLDANLTLKEATTALQVAALNGKYHQFRNALHFILVAEARCPLDIIETALDKLLNNVVTKFSGQLPSPALERSLLEIIRLTYVLEGCRSSCSCLNLLGKLSQLHSPSLVKEIASLIMPTLTLLDISDYFNILHQWKLWFNIPHSVCSELATQLYALCQSLLPAQITPSLEEQESSLQYLALSTDMKPAISTPNINHYASHFSYLVHQKFLIEMQQNCPTEKQDTDNTLVKMKAYDYKNPHSHSEVNDDHDKVFTNEGMWKVGFCRSQSICSQQFAKGTYVSIHAMRQGSCDETAFYCVAIGQISQVTCHPTDVVVEIQEPVPICLKKSVQLHIGHWKLVIVGNVTAFSRAMKAINSIRNNPTELVSQIVHHFAIPLSSDTHQYASNIHGIAKYPVIHPVVELTSTNETTEFVSAYGNVFNCSQELAIKAAFTQRLTLIHGPPGTGKTRVACEIIRRLCQQQCVKNVLAVAETNMAADNLTRCLLELKLSVIRVGKLRTVSADVHHVTLEKQLEMKRVQEMKPKTRSSYPNKSAVNSILQAANVITTTCTGAGDPTLEGMCFPFVVIDEATQVLEPISLIPLVHQCQQLVLIGDPEQLPPTLPVSVRAQDSDYGPSLRQLSVSMFHRLQQNLTPFFLEEQHRMHELLAKFPSETFYCSKLKTASGLAREPLDLVIFKQGKQQYDYSPILFIDVNFNELNKSHGAFENKMEAKIVEEVVQYLLNNEVCASQIAILTPYNSQVNCINSYIEKYNIEVSTVDRFQGREKDIIIFSTVRCNNERNIGFVNDRNRMNVLLTRARQGIVGIGSQKTLSSCMLWAAWLKQVPTSMVWSIEKFREKVTTPINKKESRLHHQQDKSSQFKVSPVRPFQAMKVKPKQRTQGQGLEYRKSEDERQYRQRDQTAHHHRGKKRRSCDVVEDKK